MVGSRGTWIAEWQKVEAGRGLEERQEQATLEATAPRRWIRNIGFQLPALDTL